MDQILCTDIIERLGSHLDVDTRRHLYQASKSMHSAHWSVKHHVLTPWNRPVVSLDTQILTLTKLMPYLTEIVFTLNHEHMKHSTPMSVHTADLIHHRDLTIKAYFDDNTELSGVHAMLEMLMPVRTRINELCFTIQDCIQHTSLIEQWDRTSKMIRENFSNSRLTISCKNYTLAKLIIADTWMTSRMKSLLLDHTTLTTVLSLHNLDPIITTTCATFISPQQSFSPADRLQKICIRPSFWHQRTYLDSPCMTSLDETAAVNLTHIELCWNYPPKSSHPIFSRMPRAPRLTNLCIFDVEWVMPLKTIAFASWMIQQRKVGITLVCQSRTVQVYCGIALHILQMFHPGHAITISNESISGTCDYNLDPFVSEMTLQELVRSLAMDENLNDLILFVNHIKG